MSDCVSPNSVSGLGETGRVKTAPQGREALLGVWTEGAWGRPCPFPSFPSPPLPSRPPSLFMKRPLFPRLPSAPLFPPGLCHVQLRWGDRAPARENRAGTGSSGDVFCSPLVATPEFKSLLRCSGRPQETAVASRPGHPASGAGPSGLVAEHGRGPSKPHGEQQCTHDASTGTAPRPPHPQVLQTWSPTARCLPLWL